MNTYKNRGEGGGAIIVTQSEASGSGSARMKPRRPSLRFPGARFRRLAVAHISVSSLSGFLCFGGLPRLLAITRPAGGRPTTSRATRLASFAAVNFFFRLREAISHSILAAHPATTSATCS